MTFIKRFWHSNCKICEDTLDNDRFECTHSDYRYVLSRKWDWGGRGLVWLMLNPSTATETVDDPTIRRCIGFTKRDGYNELLVVNLYAFRATNPDNLMKAKNPVGPLNDDVLKSVAGDSRYTWVAAWGAHPFAKARVDELVRKPWWPPSMLCLGTTKDGAPRHPLYIKSDQPFITLKYENRVRTI